MLANEYPLIIYPSLAKDIGLNEAIIVQQINYWLQRSSKLKDGHKWIYNTYEAWEKQFPFWSNATIRRTIQRLEKIGVLLSTSKYNRMKIDRTKWYTINFEHELIKPHYVPCVQSEQMVEANLTTPITIDYPSTKKEKEEGIFSTEKYSPYPTIPSIEVMDIRNYFSSMYYKKYMKGYHRHKQEQNEYINKRLQEIINEYGEEAIKAFIDNYFKYKFNHNLIHFIEPGIIENRMYEVAY